MKTITKYILLFPFIFAVTSHAQTSPYFPEVGRQAVDQDIRQIRNPSVYLVIAIAPGFEDLASIANLRIGRGADVSVAFVTNGEDIPSDLNGEMFYQLASRRKEEAYQALSYLGVHSYFLNIPVDKFSSAGFVPTNEVGKALVSRLDTVLSEVQPDIIILDRDRLCKERNAGRSAYLEKLINDEIFKNAKTSSWQAEKFLVETDHGGAVVPVEKKDPVWSKTYFQMAIEAGKFYASLKYQLPLWRVNESHHYVQVFPEVTRTTFPFDAGLPDCGGAVKTFLPAFGSVVSIGTTRNTGRQLWILHNVIAELESFTSRHQNSVSMLDMRVLVTWKFQLERLRCAILRVSIPFTVSDTVVTPVQLFFLKFGRINPAFDDTTTQIIFPGVIQKQWIVNEAQKNFYTWKDSAQLRILSPRSIALNSTETPDGFNAMQVRTPLVFFVVHRDSNPTHDFMSRHEVPLIIAPYRSVEVLTPRVAMLRDTSIVVRFRSNVRDKAGGVFFVDDSLVSSPKMHIELPGKDYVLTDTLPLLWRDSIIDETQREVPILASGNITVGRFFLHRLEVKSNIEKKIGLCSVVEDSPILIALRRLGVNPVMLDSGRSLNESFSELSTIVIDQFSLEKFCSFSIRRSSLEQWISDGGKLIVLPQYGLDTRTAWFEAGTRFSYSPVVDSTEKVETDSIGETFQIPNRIQEDGFRNQQFVISYGPIITSTEISPKVLMRAGSNALLTEKEVGHGKIFQCALNLYPELLGINQQYYELLANLLSQ